MFEPFIVNGLSSRKEIFIESVICFRKTKEGRVSLFLSLFAFVLWSLSGFTAYIYLICFIPWIWKLLLAVNSAFQYQMPTERNIEFNESSIVITTKYNEIYKVWSLPVKTIGLIYESKNYYYLLILVVDDKEYLIFNKKKFSDLENKKIHEYLNNIKPIIPA